MKKILAIYEGLANLHESWWCPKSTSVPISLQTVALILLIATAMVERAFSTMNYVRNRLHNQIGDQWCLIVYIEKDVFDTNDNDVIT